MKFFKKEQIGTLFVLVGAPEGGFRGVGGPRLLTQGFHFCKMCASYVGSYSDDMLPLVSRALCANTEP
jgi:hypothetical protein